MICSCLNDMLDYYFGLNYITHEWIIDNSYISCMESDKEKLRNRLNVRFEPFPNHRYSLKKLHVERLSKEKDKEASIISVSKNRSISIRLPAVDHKATVVESKQTTVEHKLPPLDVKPPIEHRPTESETKLQLSRLGGQA